MKYLNKETAVERKSNGLLFPLYLTVLPPLEIASPLMGNYIITPFSALVNKKFDFLCKKYKKC